MVGRDASQVTRNRIDRPGTAEEAWDEWAGLQHLPAADPLDWPSVVIVAAHPDDEVLGAGGTMAMLAAAGARLRLVAVTDGEASHPGPILRSSRGCGPRSRPPPAACSAPATPT